MTTGQPDNRLALICSTRKFEGGGDGEGVKSFTKEPESYDYLSMLFFFFAVEPKLNRREPPFFADTLVRYFIVLLVNRSIASEEKYLLDYKVSCFFVVLSRQRRFGQKH